MEKINIAELLKDCPKGMELDCTIYEDVILNKIDNSPEREYPIQIATRKGYLLDLTKYGTYTDIEEAKCVIFPIGKTTWEGFVPPCEFKDGDILAFDDNTIVIFKDLYNKTTFHSYCHIEDGVFSVSKLDCPDWWGGEFKPATKEQRDFLFQKIKEAGYKWNEETKTLEKLIKPKFKVGDRIKVISNSDQLCQYLIIGITDTHYTLEEVEDKFKYTEPIDKDKNWELVQNKFDINNLKHFDKVLVRDDNEQKWKCQIFDSFDASDCYPFKCISSCYKYCIPYKGNEHLPDTTNDCDEFYKTWK